MKQFVVPEKKGIYVDRIIAILRLTQKVLVLATRIIAAALVILSQKVGLDETVVTA